MQLHPHRRLIRPLSNGVDFLGYIVRPSHLLVRKRTVARCREAVARSAHEMTARSANVVSLSFPPEKYDRLRAALQSYLGLFSHASSRRLVQSIFAEFWEVRALFSGRDFVLKKKWELPFHPQNLYRQLRFFRKRFSGVIAIQVGCYLEFYDRDAVWASQTLGLRRISPRRRFYARCGVRVGTPARALLRKLAGRNVLLVLQSGRAGRHVVQRIAVRLTLSIEL